jgi:hypothetical protein
VVQKEDPGGQDLVFRVLPPASAAKCPEEKPYSRTHLSLPSKAWPCRDLEEGTLGRDAQGRAGGLCHLVNSALLFWTTEFLSHGSAQDLASGRFRVLWLGGHQVGVSTFLCSRASTSHRLSLQLPGRGEGGMGGDGQVCDCGSLG